jgi:hypothetical protein
MSRGKNPLERIPSSRDGFSERDIRNKGTEYDNVIKKEFEESSDVDPSYEKKYVKKESFDLEGKKTPRMYSSIEEIPDDGPLPDEFEEKSKKEKLEEEEKEAYIREYNKQSGRSLTNEEIDDEEGEDIDNGKEDKKDEEGENDKEDEEYEINEYDVNEYDDNDRKISDIKDDDSFSDDNDRNKEGMRYGVDDDGTRARQPYDKGKSSDRPIRVAKKSSFYKKSA